MLWPVPLLALTFVSLCTACPSLCTCKWKGGKQTVECVNKSMTTIPDGIESGTQVLDFSGNNVRSLVREKFRRLELVNLQKIFLSRCRISHIDDKAFRGLTNLVELDLSNNDLMAVPSEAFSDFPSLMKLSLHGNNIQEIKAGAFHQLSFLTNLDLNRCKIDKIEENAFNGLSSIEWLKLDGNRLTSLPGATTLPQSLSGITLENNPWDCDCRIIGLHDWLNKTRTPQAVDPVCTKPSRLRGIPLKNVKRDDLACLPDIEPTAVELIISEGQNISLRCEVSAMPQARVSWLFQGNVLQNDSVLEPGLHLYYFIEEGTFDKQSELFIFNTNVGDNGTFICMAENSAGRSLSNFTIRIVLKEERMVAAQTVTVEYFVIIIAGTISIILVLTITVVIFCIIKCFKQRKRRRKTKQLYNKETIINNHADSGLTQKACLSIKDCAPPLIKSNSEMMSLKAMNGCVVMDQRQSEELTVFTSEAPVLVTNDPLVSYSPMVGPASSEYHQILEQNPDLINDAKSVSNNVRSRNHSLTIENGFDLSNVINRANLSGSLAIYEAAQNPTSFHQQLHFLGTLTPPTLQLYSPADIHLMPGKFVDTDGYPVDFGLPKLLTPPAGGVTSVKPVATGVPAAYYRTLPHKRHNAANPVSRYSREAEFLSRSNAASYELYTPTDVRHNLEGYPTSLPAATAAPFPEVPAPTPFADPPPTSLASPKPALSTASTWTETSPDSALSAKPASPAPGSQSSLCAQSILTSSVVVDKPKSFAVPPTALQKSVLAETPEENGEGEQEATDV